MVTRLLLQTITKLFVNEGTVQQVSKILKSLLLNSVKKIL